MGSGVHQQVAVHVLPHIQGSEVANGEQDVCLSVRSRGLDCAGTAGCGHEQSHGRGGHQSSYTQSGGFLRIFGTFF